MKKIHINIILMTTVLLLTAYPGDYAAYDDFAEHVEFVTTKRIHPDMPEFTFIHTLAILWKILTCQTKSGMSASPCWMKMAI